MGHDPSIVQTSAGGGRTRRSARVFLTFDVSNIRVTAEVQSFYRVFRLSGDRHPRGCVSRGSMLSKGRGQPRTRGFFPKTTGKNCTRTAKASRQSGADWKRSAGRFDIESHEHPPCDRPLISCAGADLCGHLIARPLVEDPASTRRRSPSQNGHQCCAAGVSGRDANWGKITRKERMPS